MKNMFLALSTLALTYASVQAGGGALADAASAEMAAPQAPVSSCALYTLGEGPSYHWTNKQEAEDIQAGLDSFLASNHGSLQRAFFDKLPAGTLTAGLLTQLLSAPHLEAFRITGPAHLTDAEGQSIVAALKTREAPNVHTFYMTGNTFSDAVHDAIGREVMRLQVQDVTKTLNVRVN